MKDRLYTAGEIAKLTGVSLRTIRFYDARGLLKPVTHSEAGYRYYNRESVSRLQRILVLKYLGFSLQQIEEMTKTEDIEPQLSQQKSFLLQRKRQLEDIISTIEIMERSSGEEKWNYLLRLLNLLTDDEKVRQQYETSENLE
ncbi:MAG: MerR family transcriptional regulator, partial [Acetatifactor sp.]|nr:MerR family transcriptional regulator [Acetatifactor sp.]